MPLQTITISPGVQNFRGLTTGEITALGIPKNQIDPGKDPTHLQLLRERCKLPLLGGSQVSDRTRDREVSRYHSCCPYQ